jgi:DNA repair photolyase
MPPDHSGSLPLFPDPDRSLPLRMGGVSVSAGPASSIMTKASGFMGDYDFTVNPYSGCAFACSYCYAAAFAPTREAREDWGNWVKVKQNAVELFRRGLSKATGARIYMSSVTDPYQPVERVAEITRGILELMVQVQPRLTIQTRSPLVTRDIDLLKRFEVLNVNLTVTTDSEQVRKVFEPGCPSSEQRLSAVRALSDAGIDVGVTMTPLLPIVDAAAFARALRESGARRFVVQDFHAKDGDYVAGTRDAAKKLLSELSWSRRRYDEAVEVLLSELPGLKHGRDGFAPA